MHEELAERNGPPLGCAGECWSEAVVTVASDRTNDTAGRRTRIVSMVAPSGPRRSHLHDVESCRRAARPWRDESSGNLRRMARALESRVPRCAPRRLVSRAIVMLERPGNHVTNLWHRALVHRRRDPVNGSGSQRVQTQGAATRNTGGMSRSGNAARWAWRHHSQPLWRADTAHLSRRHHASRVTGAGLWSILRDHRTRSIP